MSNFSLHTSKRAFITETGYRFDEAEFAYHTWGKLNTNKDNVVLICHALTGNSDAEDWFSGLFHENSFIDLNKHFVVCINNLGSCYGSTGPWSINPATGNPYRADFPNITIRDLACYHQHFLDDFGINGIELVIGGSMGGMIALELAILDQRIKSLCLMAMGKSHSPWAIGISHAQRMAIYADKNWKDGWYEKDTPPAKGLAAARSLAMITYRTAENYRQKFDRDFNKENEIFEVESYLTYQGEKLVSRFDALSYIRLTEAMDTHDIARNRFSAEQVLSSLNIPVLVIGIESDLLYPTDEQKELAALIPNAIYKEINSPYGHDAFLIEFEQINECLKPFFKSHKIYTT